MRFIIHFWLLWLSPPKLYGGGGGNHLVNQKNPLEEKLADISQEKWDEYKKRYVPVENEWLAQTQHMNDPQYHQNARNITAIEAKATGANPTQEYQQSMLGGKVAGANFIPQADTIGNAASKASIGVSDNYVKGLQNNIAVGQGQATQALNGMSDLGQQYGQGLNQTAINSFNAAQARQGVYGTVAGGAMAAANNKVADWSRGK